MVWCAAYFDASGSPKEPKQRVFTVAGYVTTENKWDKFERDWARELAKEGVSAFSTNDFAHFQNDFAIGWRDNEPRRRAFIQSLTGVLKKWVRCGFSSSVDLDVYDEINREYEFAERVSRPYGMCASTAANKCHKWMKAFHRKDITLYVFEKGDVNQGELKTLMGEDDRFGHEPLIIEKQWRDEHGTLHYRRPFESCDFHAYESAHAVPLIGTRKALRGSAQDLFLKVKHFHGVLNRTSLLRTVRRLNVPRRGSNRFIDGR
jgi:hypothetical protein